VRARIGAGDVAGHLARVVAAPTKEREHGFGVVAGLFLQQIEIDGAPVDPRRCAGL
jgi:hypothetical protein